MTKKAKWCPTQTGKYTAYYPEWLDGEKWVQIHVVNSKVGVPPPAWGGGINSTIRLFGYAQAQALAWSYAAAVESEGKEIKVRVQAYDVRYEIKAKKIKK